MYISYLTNVTSALTGVSLPRLAFTVKVPTTVLVSGTSSSPLLLVLVLRVAALLLNKGPSSGTLSVTAWTPARALFCASTTFSVTGCGSAPVAVFVSAEVSMISRAVLRSAANVTCVLTAAPLPRRALTAKVPATRLVSGTSSSPLLSVLALRLTPPLLKSGPAVGTSSLTARTPASALPCASSTFSVTGCESVPFAVVASEDVSITSRAVLASAANLTCTLTGVSLPRRALTVKVPATVLVSGTSSSPLLSVLVLRVAALLLNRGPSAGTSSVTL